MIINVENLSKHFIVRYLKQEDIELIYKLCRKNKIFYQYHPPFITKESIKEDMIALPPNKEYEDKYYIGFFQNKQLIAVMDLILNYPEDQIAFIGFFMMNVEFQNQGIGSNIIKEIADYLLSLGFYKIRLAIDEGNMQSNAFWSKNGFIKTQEVVPNDFSSYLLMERILK